MDSNIVIWGVALVGVLGLGWDLWRDWRRHDPAYGTKVFARAMDGSK